MYKDINITFKETANMFKAAYEQSKFWDICETTIAMKLGLDTESFKTALDSCNNSTIYVISGKNLRNSIIRHNKYLHRICRDRKNHKLHTEYPVLRERYYCITFSICHPGLILLEPFNRDLVPNKRYFSDYSLMPIKYIGKRYEGYLTIRRDRGHDDILNMSFI